jgi:hypothetical protein
MDVAPGCLRLGSRKETMSRVTPPIKFGCAFFVSLIIGGPVAWSQQSEPPKDAPAKQAEARKSARLHEIYLREASAYVFFLDEPRRKKLELRREPVMRWTSAGGFNGEVYVWTYRGAAAVIGCIFSGPQDKARISIMHEFHSLSPGPLFAGEKGGPGWLSEEPGPKLEPLPDAPEPARNQPLRLAQMRDMARRFSSQVDRGNQRSEMRLLPQPLYRYEIKEEDSPVVDGAVFAFVWTVGTDPEVLVVIEGRRTDQGIRWYYAPARFTNREAWLKYQGKEVWQTGPSTAGIFDGVTTKRYGVSFVKTIPIQDEEP